MKNAEVIRYLKLIESGNVDSSAEETLKAYDALDAAIHTMEKQMSGKEAESCIKTIKLLRRLALNIHGVIDAVDDKNCKTMIEMLRSIEKMDPEPKKVLGNCSTCKWHDKGEKNEPRKCLFPFCDEYGKFTSSYYFCDSWEEKNE